MPIPTFGARRSLATALSAMQAGKLAVAACALREYFATRDVARTRRLRKADKQAAILAATCALFRGEDAELDGILKLFDHISAFSDRSVAKVLQSAMHGDVQLVYKDVQTLLKSSPIAVFIPLVMLVAAERGLEAFDQALAHTLDQAFVDVTVTPQIAGRLAFVLAVAAVRAGDNAHAVELLTNMPDDAPALHQLLAAIVNYDRSRAIILAGDVSREELRLIGQMVATMAVDQPTEQIEALYHVVNGILPPQNSVPLVAALATAYAREGRADLGMGILREHGEDPSTMLFDSARAYVSLAAGSSSVAIEVLGSRDTLDDEHRALLLLAMACASDPRLVDAVQATEKLPPVVARQISGAVIASLIAMGIDVSRDPLPAWLMIRPEAPEALFVWSVMRYLQDAHGEAVAGFVDACVSQPELGKASDIVDVAKLALTRECLRKGDIDSAYEPLSQVTSTRLRRDVRSLWALIFATREAHAADRELKDLDCFINLVMDLQQRYQATTTEGEQVVFLRRHAALTKARQLLCRGEVEMAKSVLDELEADCNDVEAVFLQAAASILSNTDLQEVERQLAPYAAHRGAHQGVVVLLSEVHAALHGGEAAINILEQHRSKLQKNALIEEARALAYGRAARGLDAKQAGFAELRRSGAKIPESLTQQIRSALALEAPPIVEQRLALPNIKRLGSDHFFPPASLGERIDILVTRAKDAQRRPMLGAKVTPLLQSLREALLNGEQSRASQLEIELVQLIG